MPNKEWSKLSNMQIGRYAEYYAKMEFASYGFDVYTSEVDDHGVDFVAKNSRGTFYEVQVKSTRKGKSSYIFVPESKAGGLSELRLLCYLRFVDDALPHVYVIPMSTWREPKGECRCVFVHHRYQNGKSKPEYGMNCSDRNMPLLECYRYRSEDVLAGIL